MCSVVAHATATRGELAGELRIINRLFSARPAGRDRGDEHIRAVLIVPGEQAQGVAGDVVFKPWIGQPVVKLCDVA